LLIALEHRCPVSISSPSGENHLGKTVAIDDSLSSARNEPLGKPACCCLFFTACFIVIAVVLVGLDFKAYSLALLRYFFATAELKVFSTVLRGWAVDLFFNFGVATRRVAAARHPESGGVAVFRFIQSWRECGFRVAPLHAARGETVAIDFAACGDDVPDVGFG
jgi:hypothetical protein